MVVTGLVILVSSCGTSDISGVYKGNFTFPLDKSSAEEYGIEEWQIETEIILNQKAKNITGVMNLGDWGITVEIKSGIVEKNQVSFICMKEGTDRYSRPYELQFKFDGKIKHSLLEGNLVMESSGYGIYGYHRTDTLKREFKCHEVEYHEVFKVN